MKQFLICDRIATFTIVLLYCGVVCPIMAAGQGTEANSGWQ